MNQTEGRASGEVPGSQPPGDLAERVALKLLPRSGIGLVSRYDIATAVRESLAPIREALDKALYDTEGEDPENVHFYLRHAVEVALRLLRGEEIPGNRGFDGGE